MSALGAVFDGWNGYQTSLAHAIKPLTREQLQWRPAPRVRSLGEIVRHLSLGRITWLARMNPPGIEDVCGQVPGWFTDADQARHVREDLVASDDCGALTHWLELSWIPIERMLTEWTVEDLFRSYLHRFRGIDYTVSNQWTVWRVMSHDVHHGGQIAMMLSCQEIPAIELRALGGHIVAPPVTHPG